ncbi:MAG: cytochrome c nitrite reductase small subunit [Armatimonadetes bacterium]|nr:cytochrome c nitrite reductase small subunit [Armatimonadota bacterium]
MGKRRIKLLATISLGVFFGCAAFTFVYARGYSYMSDDPNACINCHIMNEQHDSWLNSSHSAFANCNDCHTPKTPFAKYWVKAGNGFRHSAYFTLGNFKEPIRITPGNQKVVQDNCIRCHSDLVDSIHPTNDGQLDCLSCHSRGFHRL